MCHDAVLGDSFGLTQEFLAVMLGAHRPSVTLAAGALQMTIVDRSRLEAASCECYAFIVTETGRR